MLRFVGGAAVLLLLLLTSCNAPKNAMPALSKDSAFLIEQYWQQPVVDYHMAERKKVDSDHFQISYESIGEESNPTILLVMGHATTGVAWTKYLIEPLLEAGYHVIRYDNRDTGNSSWAADWSGKNRYDLSDMAGDGIRILDELGKKEAHVVGISMGGMIGQEMALAFPERVKTLTSIASTGHFFDPKVTSVSPDLAWKNVRMGLKYGMNPTEYIKKIQRRCQVISYLRRDKEITPEMIQVYTAFSKFENELQNKNPKAGKHHTAAIRKSGSRLDRLMILKLPVLILHGKEDQLVVPKHVSRYAPLLRNQKTVWIEEMGHVPTYEHDARMAREIIQFLQSDLVTENTK